MEKLFVPSAEKRVDLLIQENSTSFNNETISFPKKLWLQTLSEISFWLYSFHQKQQLRYKRIVEKLTDESLPQPKIKVQKKAASVSEEIINEILYKLKEFEINKGYLDKDLDLSSLAKTLGTNHSYLSRVINQVKEKSFKNYLNDLRIEYAYVDLQTNPKKRRYTIEAIARDVGFKSAESFSKKFKQRFEMYPSVFLKKLNEAA
ncbi:MAG TPA: hypothetical protein DCS66_03140 [Flavobacteriaceae bacterium]|nr:hypothetical protein [Flavobacteriaceae bacterium]HAT63583.1 hypothetical protein [Flavobacteriaceae bacterium]|tara:strand:- start:34213 stop:34824 length:612 start_codon:yes stop_codon:yes gene_type:complete